MNSIASFEFIVKWDFGELPLNLSLCLKHFLFVAMLLHVEKIILIKINKKNVIWWTWAKNRRTYLILPTAREYAKINSDKIIYKFTEVTTWKQNWNVLFIHGDILICNYKLIFIFSKKKLT